MSPLSDGKQKYKQWLPAELNALTAALRHGLNNHEIAAQLGRTPAAVAAKASQIGNLVWPGKSFSEISAIRLSLLRRREQIGEYRSPQKLPAQPRRFVRSGPRKAEQAAAPTRPCTACRGAFTPLWPTNRLCMTCRQHIDSCGMHDA